MKQSKIAKAILSHKPATEPCLLELDDGETIEQHEPHIPVVPDQLNVIVQCEKYGQSILLRSYRARQPNVDQIWTISIQTFTCTRL